MSEKYFLISNGSRALAVSLEQIIEALKDKKDVDVNDEEQLKVCALALAGDRFQAAHQPHQDLKLHQIVELEDGSPVDGDPDGPEDIGLTESVLIEVARHVYGSDDLEFDDDAMFSGMNVQGWSHVSASQALEALTEMEPALIRREQPARGSKAEQDLDALKAQTRSLLNLVGVLAASGAQPSPADLDALGQQAKIVEQLLGDASKGEQVVHATTIRSWQVGEKSDEGYTDDQRKPWSVTLTQSGDQLRLNVWPKGESIDEATTGLGVLIEVNGGAPALHLASSPNADNCCHVHQFEEDQLEITFGCTRDGAIHRASRAYEGAPAIIVGNRPIA